MEMIILSATMSSGASNDNTVWVVGIILLCIIAVLLISLIINLVYYKITGKWLEIPHWLKRKEDDTLYIDPDETDIHMGGALDMADGSRIISDVVKYSSEKKSGTKEAGKKEQDVILLFEEIYNANVIGKCSRCDADILKDQDVCVVCGQQIKDI